MSQPLPSLPARRPHDYLSTAQVRALIRQNLGYNNKQVSVSQRHSLQYLTVTVRDPKVDLARVIEFADHLDTWTMDQSDYCEGQSLNVQTTDEVDAAHAAPFIEEIKAKAAALSTDTNGRAFSLSNGKMLHKSDQGYYVTNGDQRGTYIWPHDVERGSQYAIASLAKQAARV